VVGFLVFLFEEWKLMGDLSNAAGFWLSGPSLFLAFFMLTEPFTMPPTKKLQALYGAVVGFTSQTTLFLPLGVKMTPELALIVGNVLFFPATLRQKLFLRLKCVREVALHTYEFVFHKPRSFTFAAGQYLEWMLPHTRPDNRGIRRYFTVASAPEEDFVRLGIRFGATVSTYKSALLAMQPGDTIIASQRAGDFLLPSDSSKKLGFIAGGIGVTPFISHLESMSRSQTKNNTVLFYCNNTSLEIAYYDRLQALALVLPLRLVHILAKEKREGFESGFLNTEMIRQKSPDYLERHWYLSGPPGMVNAYSRLLRELGVPKRQILKDFFPGLA
jgi:ferredoxin-NADP reductase